MSGARTAPSAAGARCQRQDPQPVWGRRQEESVLINVQSSRCSVSVSKKHQGIAVRMGWNPWL